MVRGWGDGDDGGVGIINLIDGWYQWLVGIISWVFIMRVERDAPPGSLWKSGKIYQSIPLEVRLSTQNSEDFFGVLQNP